MQNSTKASLGARIGFDPSPVSMSPEAIDFCTSMINARKNIMGTAYNPHTCPFATYFSIGTSDLTIGMRELTRNGGNNIWTNRLNMKIDGDNGKEIGMRLREHRDEEVYKAALQKIPNQGAFAGYEMLNKDWGRLNKANDALWQKPLFVPRTKGGADGTDFRPYVDSTREGGQLGWNSAIDSGIGMLLNPAAPGASTKGYTLLPGMKDVAA